ncbi:hypothetical protein KFK09_004789 [Dendrobium nobile]|uniref:Uncharacterized protein n=1 Tax=Dendrobium nobile TaxID=94219 RepID=A0A8T3BTX9_DENNO|nr:hypothetical protein KFK09_004789 [Dendrobium nobile]
MTLIEGYNKSYTRCEGPFSLTHASFASMWLASSHLQRPSLPIRLGVRAF